MSFRFKWRTQLASNVVSSSPMRLLPRWLRRARCPANPDEKELVEQGFTLLQSHFGPKRLLQATVIEPNDTFFPDPYDGSPEAAAGLFDRVCDYMHVDPATVGLNFWQEEERQPRVHAPGTMNRPEQTKGASGYYAKVDGIHRIFLNVSELRDPEALVSTMAHELAHVVLLGSGAMSHDQPHMEALTDLATIYVGFGIFTSNTLLRRRGWVYGNVEGWSVSRKGYISPEMAGWALSLFAWVRGENNPKWAKHLAVDPMEYLKLGLRYLDETHDTAFVLSKGAVGG
jgi:hypothetical protein